MINRQKGTVLLILAGVFGLFTISRIPRFLVLITRISDPEAAGEVTGIAISSIAVIVCFILGIKLFKQPDNKNNSPKT